ncbi:MAG TPA: response regulator transcription factor [Ideonella sp.]|uniref:response regulator transcription factor n=1 Tax=Ideonella sp. TaxID=1929293 RepID=UPI002E2F29EB|nr:response regulator transcription factor [Ideonella sp.]HEX5683052.1 response regulator transcription factor [Ideonella sp.]
MKVLLVDDHPLILSALKAMIENLSPGVVVNAVSNAKEARFTLRVQQDHDLMLLDLQLGDANGFELLTEVRQTDPDLSVVVLSSSDRASDVIQAIDLGAMGFLPKRMTTEDLADALRLVMAGGIYVPTMTVNPVRDADEPAPAAFHTAPAVAESLPSFEELGITPRQADVLTLLLQGKSNKDIARRLGLSVETIKDHVQAVLRALGVSSRTQAVLAVGQMTQKRRGGR